MKRILLVVFQLFAIKAFAQSAFQGEDTIVVVSGPTGECATGVVVSPNQMLVNEHLARSLCSPSACPDITIRSGEEDSDLEVLGQHLELKLEMLIPSLDAAILSGPLPTPSTQLLAPAPPVVGSKVWVIGYPRCGPLKRSQGSIVSSNTLFVETTSPADFGSSGSIFFSEAGAPIGFAARASSVGGAIKSHLLGGDLAIAGINYSLLHSLVSSQSPTSRLEAESNALLEYYRSSVRTASGFGRLSLGREFLGMVDGIREEANLEGVSAEAAPLLSLRSYLWRIPLPTAPTPLQGTLTALVMAANLELHGLSRSIFRHTSPENLVSQLNQALLTDPVRSISIELVSFSAAHKYPGLALMDLTYYFSLAVLAVLISALWGASIVYVIRTLRGTRWLIAFKILAFAVFWPLSFIPLLVSKRKGTRNGMEKHEV